MAEQVLFKSQTFGGFNKEEVLKYIDNIYAENFEKEKAANEEKEALTKELAEKTESFDELQAKYDEIMAAYEELRQHYLMLKEHDENITAENEKLSDRVAVTEKELAIEKELNSQLEDKLEAEQKKAEEFAMQEKKLLVTIGDAENSAKLMLAGAKNGAQNMIASAQSSAETINTEIDDFKDELEKTKTFMEDSLAVLVQRLDYIAQSAEGVKIPCEDRSVKADEIQKKYEELVSETEAKTAALKKRFFR